MYALLFLALVGLVAAVQPPGDSVCNPPPDFCLATPHAFELIVYRTHHAGWIYVTIDDELLNVTYDVSGPAPDCDWKLVDMQLWLSTDFDTVPTTVFGVPLPGLFPRQAVADCSAEKYTFTYKLKDIFGIDFLGNPRIACDDIIWFSAHANLICTDVEDDFANIQCAPAWGNGTHFIPQPAEDWGMYNYVQVLCDDDCEPVDYRTVCATTFAMIPDNCYGAESLCFSTLGENSTMWGWYTKIDKFGHYTFDIHMGEDDFSCPPDLGDVVGQVYVDYHASQKFLVRLVTKEGYYIEQDEIYLSKDMPEATFPGKYPGHVAGSGFEHDNLHTRLDEFEFANPDARKCRRNVANNATDCDEPEEGGLFFIVHAIVCEGEVIEEIPPPDKGPADR